MSHTGTVKWAFLNNCAHSRLKPSRALVVETWKVLIPICHVLYLWKRDARNLKDYQIRQGSNVKLFGAQRKRETTKLLKFLGLIKAMFDCGGNTRQRSAGVRLHEGNWKNQTCSSFRSRVVGVGCMESHPGEHYRQIFQEVLHKQCFRRI